MPNTTQQQTASLVERITAAVEDQFVVKTDYSGRGMMGRRCIAICYDRAADLVEIGSMLRKTLSQSEIALLVQGLRTDSLGMAHVAYFPSLDTTPPLDHFAVHYQMPEGGDVFVSNFDTLDAAVVFADAARMNGCKRVKTVFPNAEGRN